jgi:hypothetical protein
MPKAGTKFIEDKAKRWSSRSKRISGLMKKSEKLAELTDCNVCVVISHPDGKRVYEYYSKRVEPEMALVHGCARGRHIRKFMLETVAIPTTKAMRDKQEARAKARKKKLDAKKLKKKNGLATTTATNGSKKTEQKAAEGKDEDDADSQTTSTSESVDSTEKKKEKNEEEKEKEDEESDL